MRCADAAARWPIIRSMPSCRNGGWSMQHVGVERDDVADRRLAVDGEVPAVEQHERLPERGRFSSSGDQLAADVGVLDVAPTAPARRPPARCCSWRSSAANDFTTRTPLMFSSTTVATSARRAWMSHDTGNIWLAHPHADDAHERHRRHRDERQRHVDRQHLHEREDGDAALHEDRRRERQVHLHRADVGVGPRDELARLHPVVERERQPAQVLVHDVPQVVLDAYAVRSRSTRAAR